jgi:hypothetical protein
LTGIPFIHIRSTGTSLRVGGENTCLLGHQIPSVSSELPDGVFAEWDWNGERLEVRNDRYGFYPVYYFANEREICVSPSLLELLHRGAPRVLNDTALAVFFRIGFFLGEDTPFRDIHALPPASRLIWTHGRIELTSWESLPKPQTISREQVIDGYIELFRSAIQRREPKESFSIPLSGGRDSRHTALEVHRNGWRPRAFITVDPGNSDEATVARTLAERMNIRHEVVPAMPPSFKAQERKNAATSFCSDEHQWLLGLVDHIETAGERCIYDGIGGDVLSAGLFLDPQRHSLYEQGAFRDLANLLMKPAERMIRVLFRADAVHVWSHERATERLSRELARYTAAANPVGAFYFWNRTRREIALYSYSLLRNVRTVFAPFVDHTLYDFLASAPASVFMDHKLHSETIARAYPEFADIPYAVKRVASPAYYTHMRQFAIDTLFYVLREKREPLLRTPYVLTRLCAGALLPRRIKAARWIAPMAVYICQLQRVSSSIPEPEPFDVPKPEQLIR